MQHVKKQINIGKLQKTDDDEFGIPFTPVDLCFEDLTYNATASTLKDTLRLLNEVNDVFKAG